MDYRTFDQWSNAGYKIIKGSKATWINDVPMFSEHQVTRYIKKSYGNHWRGNAPKGSFDYWATEDEDQLRYDPWMGGYF